MVVCQVLNTYFASRKALLFSWSASSPDRQKRSIDVLKLDEKEIETALERDVSVPMFKP